MCEVWSFTQKNNLLEGLKRNKKIIASAEQKLIKMEELDEIEDALYNAVCKNFYHFSTRNINRAIFFFGELGFFCYNAQRW